jgi:hypothetical protein
MGRATLSSVPKGLCLKFVFRNFRKIICLSTLFLHLVPFTPTMPPCAFQICKRAPKGRVYSGSQLGGKDQKVKVLKASQIGERKKQVKERRKQQEELRKTFLITREYH